MGILDDAIREHLELKRAHGATDDEIRRKEVEAFGPLRQEAAATAATEPATEMLRPDDVEDELHAAPDVHPDPNAGHPAEAHTEHYAVEHEPLDPAPEDPYAVHPGDHPVPDPHDHAHPAASDPAWREDTDLFAEEPAHEDAISPAAAAGAGMLEGHHGDPGPPTPPEHHLDEQHPALHDHDAIHSEEHPPEPVFRREPPAPRDESTPPDAPLEPSPVDDPPVGDPPVERPEIDEPPPRQSAEQAGDGEDGDGEDVLEETPEFLQDAPEHDRLWFEQKPPRDFDFGE